MKVDRTGLGGVVAIPGDSEVHSASSSTGSVEAVWVGCFFFPCEISEDRMLTSWQKIREDILTH